MTNILSTLSTKEKLAVMQHFANGGDIEFLDHKHEHYETWRATDTPTWNWATTDYRIKTTTIRLYPALMRDANERYFIATRLFRNNEEAEEYAGDSLGTGKHFIKLITENYVEVQE